MDNKEAPITREKFREEYPSMNLMQAIINIKTLIDASVKSGLFKTIEEAVVLNKSFELIEDFVKEKNVTE